MSIAGGYYKAVDAAAESATAAVLEAVAATGSEEMEKEGRTLVTARPTHPTIVTAS